MRTVVSVAAFSTTVPEAAVMDGVASLTGRMLTVDVKVAVLAVPGPPSVTVVTTVLTRSAVAVS